MKMTHHFSFMNENSEQNGNAHHIRMFTIRTHLVCLHLCLNSFRANFNNFHREHRLVKCEQMSKRKYLLKFHRERRKNHRKQLKRLQIIGSIQFIWMDHFIIGEKSDLNANHWIDPQKGEILTIDRRKLSYEPNAMSAHSPFYSSVVIWVITSGQKKIEEKKILRFDWRWNKVSMIF